MKKSMIYVFNRTVLTLGFLLVGMIFAQAQTFIGTTGNQLWSDRDNWLDGQMPNHNYSCVIISADVIIDVDVIIGKLINSGNYSLTILEGKKLTVNSSIDWGDENDFVLEDKAQLDCPTRVRVTVKKKYLHIDHLWNLIASPVEDDIMPSIENGFLTEPETGYALYSFDEATAQWHDFKESPFFIEKGRGYLYGNAYDTTLLFQGKTTGAVAGYSISYHASNGVLAGCNIKGNPLPCDAFIDRSYYVFSEEGNSLVAVAYSMSRPVALCTGIVVQAKSMDDNAVWFNSGAYEQPFENQGYIEITAAKSDAPTFILDHALISFNSGDDLADFPFFEGSPRVYFTKDNHDLAILSIDSTDMQPLKFKAVENGVYNLRFDLKDLNLDYLHLIDNVAGVNTDLLINPVYTFSASTNDYTSRFKLVFDPHFGVEELVNQNFAYYADGVIYINDVETQNHASLQIVDLTGRVVYQGDAKDSVSTSNLVPGVYILRLVTGDAVWTQKIVIQ